MTYLDNGIIESWHAHVYFDELARDTAKAFRQAVGERFVEVVRFGRFNEGVVGQHPVWSYEISFGKEDFADVVGWLVLNHGALDIFLHPNTDDGLRDHRDSAVWIGQSHVLNLLGLGS